MQYVLKNILSALTTAQIFSMFDKKLTYENFCQTFLPEVLVYSGGPALAPPTRLKLPKVVSLVISYKKASKALTFQNFMLHDTYTLHILYLTCNMKFWKESSESQSSEFHGTCHIFRMFWKVSSERLEFHVSCNIFRISCHMSLRHSIFHISYTSHNTYYKLHITYTFHITYLMCIGYWIRPHSLHAHVVCNMKYAHVVCSIKCVWNRYICISIYISCCIIFVYISYTFLYTFHVASYIIH